MLINNNYETKNTINCVIILLIAIIYLFDQKINSILNFNGLGFIILILIFIFSNQINTKINDIFFISLSLFYIIISFLFSPCELTFKFIFSIVLLPLLIIIILSGYLSNIVKYKYISNFILISVSVSLLISANLDKIFYLDRLARFYYEYSHVALYISPIIIYRLFDNYKDKLVWFAIVIISIYSFSVTFFVTLTFTLFFVIKIYNLKRLYLILSVPLIASSFFYSDHIVDRLLGLFHTIDSTDSNLSSLVWLNGFSMAFEYLKLTNGMGIGFNQMGCNNFGDIGDYSSLIGIANNGIILNSEDGSFAASKIISELGLFGLLLVVILTFYSLYILIKSFYSKNWLNLNFLILSGAISTLICLYVRSAGYYQLHFILSLSLLLSQAKHINLSRN